ncbi:DNA-binding response regulator [Oceaniferula spumae]|uniref:DNA-binding response regulator n=1 Tax=Oceaniferula spumae TaxID=2979115 RepID=A0AAT9FIX9_9BACT
MKPKLRLTLIEDSMAYRKGIICAMEDRMDMELVSEFGTVEIALRSLETDAPDLVLLDLNLPGMTGLEAIPLIKKIVPDAKIVILTQSDKEADVLQAIGSGASGYLLKSSSMAQLIDGIKHVCAGGAILDPNLAKFIMDTLQEQLSEPASNALLTKRELEILTLIAEGLAQKQIATELGLSVHTVSEYIRNIYEKLNVPNAPSAIHKAHSMGIFRQK